jgi:hypothetical protein
MKRNFVLLAIFALSAMSAAAQDKATNFAGTWNLDVAKSQLGERNNIESQVMTVTQTAATLKVETATKRTAPQTVNPGGMPAGTEPGKPRMGGGQGGGMGGGRFGGGDTPWTYGLDGKDTKGEMQGPMGAMPVTMNAKFDGPKLNLSRSSTFNSPSGGEVTMTNKETWDLSADGKTLTVNGERTSMRGTETTTKVFTKKDQK